MKALMNDVLIIPLFLTKRRFLIALYSKADATQRIALWVDSRWKAVGQ